MNKETIDEISEELKSCQKNIRDLELEKKEVETELRVDREKLKEKFGITEDDIEGKLNELKKQQEGLESEIQEIRQILDNIKNPPTEESTDDRN